MRSYPALCAVLITWHRGGFSRALDFGAELPHDLPTNDRRASFRRYGNLDASYDVRRSSITRYENDVTVGCFYGSISNP